MAEFVNPFSGVTPDRRITFHELTRAIRLSLSAEGKAIHLNEAIADATDNELARAVMQEVANEERVHAGEFQRVLNILPADEHRLMTDGASEGDDIQQELSPWQQRINGTARSGQENRNCLGRTGTADWESASISA